MAFNSVEAWYKKNSSIRILAPLAFIFAVITRVRRWLYAKELFKTHKFAVPVIIVGNLTVGGTGKTPLVIYLALQLKKRGFSPGIVSRGYGGNSKNYPVIVQEDSIASEVGDEPLLIKRRTQVPMVVDPKRPRAVEKLLACHEVNVVISDDGLQHYALARDIEIVVIDGQRRFGNGLCLPAGPLREPHTRLQEIDFIVSNGIAAVGEYTMEYVATELCEIGGANERISVDAFDHKTVHAVAGIGNPARFFTTLRELGFSVIEHAFADHHAFKATDLSFDDDLAIIMTEKDAVKCAGLALKNAWYLPVTAKLDHGFMRDLRDAIGDADKLYNFKPL